MKFISVRRLAAVFKLEFSSINDELIEKIRKSIDQYFENQELLTVFGQDFNQKELLFIHNQLKEDKVRVFHDWVENDHVLAEYLFSKGEIVLPDEEIDVSKDELLFETYKDFLSDYLAPILIQKTTLYIKEENLTKLKSHLKFSPLLPRAKRIEIEKPVVLFLNQAINQLKVSQGRHFEEQLKLVYSIEFVQTLNGLVEKYYTNATDYFETSKLLIKRNDLSPLLLDTVKSAITSLDLKEEDYNKALNFINSETFQARSKLPKSNLNEMVKSPFFLVAVILVVINFVFLYDCEGGKEKAVPSENDFETKLKKQFPDIIDTFHFESTNKKLEERNFSNYRPLYFGEKRDTLYADYNLASYAFGESTIIEVVEDKELMRLNKVKVDLFNKKREGYADYYKDLNFHIDSIPTTWEEAKIKITIDTSQLIRNIGRKKYENKEFVYNAYPVILENLSDTLILIGYGSQIPLTLEVKEANGKWKAVEFQYSYACGNGLPSITLSKNEIVLTSAAVVDFDNKTELRLSIGGNYSEVFWGGE